MRRVRLALRDRIPMSAVIRTNGPMLHRCSVFLIGRVEWHERYMHTRSTSRRFPTDGRALSIQATYYDPAPDFFSFFDFYGENESRPLKAGENPHDKEKTPRAFQLRGVCILAERVGFEPTVRYNRTPDFESGAFDLSATFPSTASPFCRSRPGEAKIIEQLFPSFQALFAKNFASGQGECRVRFVRAAAPDSRPQAAEPGSSIFSRPPRYGRSATGTVTEPSAFW